MKKQTNKNLKEKYDSMHKQGASAWYGDGREERETILKMGEPWTKIRVLEIGCGEGDLAHMIKAKGSYICGIDYSIEALSKAHEKYPTEDFLYLADYKTFAKSTRCFNRIVMQGVLEHLDDPFTELKWMMDNLLGEHGDVITSSPCFLNPRGIVWMTLDMLGAVMSKTDLHFIDPNDMEKFCIKHDYTMQAMDFCDWSWGNGNAMIEDLTKRIPLALRDGKIPYDQDRMDKFLNWLKWVPGCGFGATAVYRITK